MTGNNVRICAICGGEITSGRSDRKYCSRECYLKSKRLRKAEQLEKQAVQNRKIAEERNEKLRKEKLRADKTMQRSYSKNDYGNLTARYWKELKAEELRWCKSFGITSTMTANGISVHDPDFEKKVLETVKTEGRFSLSRT